MHKEENKETFAFIDWLSNVNEQINLIIRHGFQSTDFVLRFYIPSGFYECLENRFISIFHTHCVFEKQNVSKEKVNYVRSRLPPFGAFVKHQWKIRNILDFKKAFDTDLVSRHFLNQRLAKHLV